MIRALRGRGNWAFVDNQSGPTRSDQMKRQIRSALGVSQKVRHRIPCGAFFSTAMFEISMLASFGIDPAEQEHFDQHFQFG
jgi:hypothetical protein